MSIARRRWIRSMQRATQDRNELGVPASHLLGFGVRHLNKQETERKRTTIGDGIALLTIALLGAVIADEFAGQKGLEAFAQGMTG